MFFCHVYTLHLTPPVCVVVKLNSAKSPIVTTPIVHTP